MKIIAETGSSELAMVYIADYGKERILEFVEALQAPFSRNERWILMVSTLFGCPVKCLICDAGGRYHGKPTKEQIFDQIDYLVDLRFPGRVIPCKKFKIQFARMGEPALNPAVLDVLSELPFRYKAPGLMPSVSTIAPYGCDAFMDQLIDIKDEHFSNGKFQFQYSLHSTDQEERDRLIPVKKWNFDQLTKFGDRYLKKNDRKITLNFALGSKVPIDEKVLLNYFDPEKYLVKITPINPTHQAQKNKIESYIIGDELTEIEEVASKLRLGGYDVIVSIGELEENNIGSNCGQYVVRHLQGKEQRIDGYSYPIHKSEGISL
ncbi:radical SAM protein [Chloroflexota bacterium]